MDSKRLDRIRRMGETAMVIALRRLRAIGREERDFVLSQARQIKPGADAARIEEMLNGKTISEQIRVYDLRNAWKSAFMVFARARYVQGAAAARRVLDGKKEEGRRQRAEDERQKAEGRRQKAATAKTVVATVHETEYGKPPTAISEYAKWVEQLEEAQWTEGIRRSKETILKNMAGTWSLDDWKEKASDGTVTEHPGVVSQLRDVFQGMEDTDLMRKARTEYTRAVGLGAVEEARQDEMVVAVERSEVHDDRECEVCRELDGKRLPKNDPGVEELIAPAHPNCRVIPKFIFAWEAGAAVV